MTRFGLVLTTYSAMLVVGTSAVFHPAPKLIWNASASVRIGLYGVAVTTPPFASLAHSDLVVVRPPEALAGFLDRRRYLPRGVPLLKHIAALPGQIVCRWGARVTIDSKPVAEALTRDRRGRSLPVWKGCRRLLPSEIFLLNRDRRDSLDGRYFGPLPRASVIGRATAIWTPGER